MNRWVNIQLAALLVAATVSAQPLSAQEEAPPTQLNDQFEATDYYVRQERAAWRENTAELAEIDKAYSETTAELSRENARRLKVIFQSNSDTGHVDEDCDPGIWYGCDQQ